jgi:hypothetical protein
MLWLWQVVQRAACSHRGCAKTIGKAPSCQQGAHPVTLFASVVMASCRRSASTEAAPSKERHIETDTHAHSPLWSATSLSTSAMCVATASLPAPFTVWARPSTPVGAAGQRHSTVTHGCSQQQHDNMTCFTPVMQAWGFVPLVSHDMQSL